MLNSELSARNRVAPINTLAVPVVLYSYGVTDWKVNEIQDLDKLARKQLCRNWDACKERRYWQGIPLMSRRWKISDEPGEKVQGNNGSTTEVYDQQRWHPNPTCPQTPELYDSSLCTQGSWDKAEWGWNYRWYLPVTIEKQQHGRPRSWNWSTRKTTRKWRRTNGRAKPCMASSPNQPDEECVDVELSIRCMKHCRLKAETEGLITASQDQALNTRYYSKHIIKQGTTDRYRMCHTQPKIVEHIISGYQTLEADKDLNRHSQVAGQLQLDISKYYVIKVDVQHSYQHNLE